MTQSAEGELAKGFCSCRSGAKASAVWTPRRLPVQQLHSWAVWRQWQKPTVLGLWPQLLVTCVYCAAWA